MNHVGSNHNTAAAWNRGLTIRLLRQHGTLTRNDIARMTQLQGSTLNYIVRELLENQVVRIVGKRKSSSVGKKQVLITLNPALGWMLGVSLRPESAKLVLLDAAGGRIDSTKTPLDGTLDSLAHKLQEALTRWFKKRGTPEGEMLGLGVSVPGVVDSDSGVVLRSRLFGVVNMPLRKNLEDQFGVTCVVDHDACCGAFAEATDGEASDVSNFVYFDVNIAPTNDGHQLSGYGSALYLQGKLYRGTFYGAGELSDSLEPPPMKLSNADLDELTNSNGTMPPSLVQLSNQIGAAIAPIINLIDPQMVVLASMASILNRRFVAAVQAVVTDKLVAIPGRAVRIVCSKWGPEASARGAALAAFDAVVVKGQLFSDTDERKMIRTAKEDSSITAQANAG